MNRRLARLVVTVVAGAAVALGGCGRPINVAALTAADVPLVEKAGNFPHLGYRIEPGDTLQIRYTFHQELNQDVAVQPDGKILVAQIGEVVVGGLGTAELERRLVGLASDRLRNPEIVVSVAKFSEKNIFVGGEVLRPGTIVYRQGLTPLQAVLAVGGFRDTARLDSIVLIRTDTRNGEVISRKLDLEEAVKDGTREVLSLAPHDVLFVPRTDIAEANLWVRQHITDLFPFIRGLGATMPLIP